MQSPLPIENPVCDRPEFAEGLICKKLVELDVQAEHEWQIILDARDIGLILEKFSVDDVNRVCDMIIRYTSVGTPTYAGLLELLKVETSKAVAIAGILTRHYGMFYSTDAIVLPDIRLLNYAAYQLKVEVSG
jgi:hypothetical protein